MAQASRQQFEIDLRVMGTEAAIRKHMFTMIEEVSVLRLANKEMAGLLDGMMDVLKQVTEVGAATASAIQDFKRRNDNNDAIFNQEDR